MRIALIIFVCLHGIIHLLGFFKAYGISNVEGIKMSVTKTSGLLWLFVFFLFIASAVLFLVQSELWWGLGGFAVISSQVLIFNAWSDAKYGTIANLIILIALVLDYLEYIF